MDNRSGVTGSLDFHSRGSSVEGGGMRLKLRLVRGQRSVLGARRGAGLAVLVVCSVFLLLSLLGHDCKGVMSCRPVPWTQRPHLMSVLCAVVNNQQETACSSSGARPAASWEGCCLFFFLWCGPWLSRANAPSSLKPGTHKLGLLAAASA